MWNSYLSGFRQKYFFWLLTDVGIAKEVLCLLPASADWFLKTGTCWAWRAKTEPVSHISPSLTWERCHMTLVFCRIHLPSHYFSLIAQVLMLHWYFFFYPIFILLKGAASVFPHVNLLGIFSEDSIFKRDVSGSFNGEFY